MEIRKVTLEAKTDEKVYWTRELAGYLSPASGGQKLSINGREGWVVSASDAESYESMLAQEMEDLMIQPDYGTIYLTLTIEDNLGLIYGLTNEYQFIGGNSTSHKPLELIGQAN